MARLTKLSKDEVSGDVRELYTNVGKQRGNVPNMFRIYAHRPDAYYDEGEIVEISAMAGLFNYFNRVNDAIGTEPTKPGAGL